MGIYRKSAQGYQESPERQIYGIKNNRVIVPLDVCILEQGADNPRLILPSTPIFENTADIILTGGDAKIGTIKDYDIPSVLSGINPVVRVKPADDVEFSDELLNSLNNPLVPEDVNVGDKIVLIIDGVRVTGEIVEGLANFSYELLDFEVNAYQVKFNRLLLDFVHGARVFNPRNNKTLGMLISTENQADEDGNYLALVYPAHLI